jgi:hypothetical protein
MTQEDSNKFCRYALLGKEEVGGIGVPEVVKDDMARQFGPLTIYLKAVLGCPQGDREYSLIAMGREQIPYGRYKLWYKVDCPFL